MRHASVKVICRIYNLIWRTRPDDGLGLPYEIVELDDVDGASEFLKDNIWDKVKDCANEDVDDVLTRDILINLLRTGQFKSEEQNTQP